MKPEDWANLQVGASAALCSVGVLWAPPGTVWAGGPLTRECQRATPAPTHTHTHWGTRVSPYAWLLSFR